MTEPEAPAARPAPAMIVAGLVAALVDIVTGQIQVSYASAWVRGLTIVYALALFAAFGLAIAATEAIALYAVERLGAKGRRRAALLFASMMILGGGAVYWLIERVYARQSSALLDGRYSDWLYAGFVVGGGLGVVIVRTAGGFLGRGRFRFALGVVLSLAALIGNQLKYVDDYPETHATVVLGAMLMLGPSLGGRLARFGAWLRGSRPRRIGAVAILAVSTIAALVGPPNAVRLALFRTPGSAGAWVFANTTWTEVHVDGTPDPRIAADWLGPAKEGTRPRSGERLIAGTPVVVLLTIDAVRADVIADPARAEQLPNLTRMKREGVWFSDAHAPGSQTAVTLTATFSGKYFSEMKWERFGAGSSRFEYTIRDETPRFPALLSERGVATFKSVSLTFLENAYSVAPGFAEQEIVTVGRRHAKAVDVVAPLLLRLRRAEEEPLFVYAHLTEPHSPYDRGRFKGTPAFERYVSEIAAADEYVGRIMRELEKSGLKDRGMLIVTSDHGEAFGEHRTWEHTKTIYEELVRVPLLVWGAGVEPRKVDVPVTLLDLGPTVLDVFDVPTPDHWMGESLVPALRGEAFAPTRPILAEGRLRRAMYVGDLKVMVDLRRKTIEAYDLAADPGETINLYEEDRARVLPGLAAMSAFFNARECRVDGYEPIYKP